MSVPVNISFEGTANLDLPHLMCVCGFCGNNDTKNTRVEINFREKKIFYKCSECKKVNEIELGKDQPPPYPKSKIR